MTSHSDRWGYLVRLSFPFGPELSFVAEPIFDSDHRARAAACLTAFYSAQFQNLLMVIPPVKKQPSVFTKSAKQPPAVPSWALKATPTSAHAIPKKLSLVLPDRESVKTTKIETMPQDGPSDANLAEQEDEDTLMKDVEFES